MFECPLLKHSLEETRCGNGSFARCGSGTFARCGNGSFEQKLHFDSNANVVYFHWIILFSAKIVDQQNVIETEQIKLTNRFLKCDLNFHNCEKWNKRINSFDPFSAKTHILQFGKYKLFTSQKSFLKRKSQSQETFFFLTKYLNCFVVVDVVVVYNA